MQSTGHTSTQERSFTPMQGSAMMYGMRRPRLSRHPALGANRKHRLGPPPVKCAARSRFVPVANDGRQRLVEAAREAGNEERDDSPCERHPHQVVAPRRRDARPRRRVLISRRHSETFVRFVRLTLDGRVVVPMFLTALRPETVARLAAWDSDQYL